MKPQPSSRRRLIGRWNERIRRTQASTRVAWLARTKRSSNDLLHCSFTSGRQTVPKLKRPIDESRLTHNYQETANNVTMKPTFWQIHGTNKITRCSRGCEHRRKNSSPFKTYIKHYQKQLRWSHGSEYFHYTNAKYLDNPTTHESNARNIRYILRWRERRSTERRLCTYNSHQNSYAAQPNQRVVMTPKDMIGTDCFLAPESKFPRFSHLIVYANTCRAIPLPDSPAVKPSSAFT